MESPELLFVCASAFAAVFALLAILAAVMRIIIVLFPHKEEATDAAVMGAVAAVMTTLYPGTRVTKVEEIK